MDITTEDIWLNMNQSLKAFILKRVRNVHDADDILQTVFAKIHANINGIKDESKLYAWVYRITKNSVTDYYRTQNDHMELHKIEQELEAETECQDLNDEIIICLKSMINCLPDIYREALLLSELGNLTQKELAEKLGISVSGAKSRVQRARRKLKIMLTDCCKLYVDRYGNIIDYEHKHEHCRFC